MKLLLSGILVLFCLFCSFGQIFYSNGAILSIATGALVQVNGGMELAQSTVLTNQGNLTITKNSTLSLPGTFRIGPNAASSGNGAYLVEQDWINDGVFNAGTSTVTLFGNTQQFITSSSGISTTFNNLVLTGTGAGNNRKKTLKGVNASTGPTGILQINARELETQANTFTVLNPAVAAVTYTNTFGAEGFVSSLQPGTFMRTTNSTGIYLFPTGSSNGTLRFRPIELTPQTNESSLYAVRFNNYDANNDNFNRAQTDGNMCALNPAYYHSINRESGSAPTDVRMFYIIADDGDWTGMAHWRTASTNWNDMATTTSGINGGFTTRTKAGWNFSNPGEPYILSTAKLGPPTLNCPIICENSSNNVFSVTGGSGNFQWIFPSNGTITGGQGTSSVTADWTTGTGQVTVVDQGTNGCSSQPGNCAPIVNPSPAVQFTYTEDGPSYSFTNQTFGSVSWNWFFGDGNGSSVQNPAHTYEDGGDSYQVTLIVTNNNGCSGSTTQTIEIFHDIVVPNIITPNDDGTNDFFLIKTVGIKSYDLVIVNRWGNTVFTSSDPAVIWDGKWNGQPVDDGVYFYKLRASSASKKYNYQGNVTVIRN
ncbi:gliding motility-associated C-terminal domain-containing protein [Fluviicola sp.]|jgi:gliding motility-associated-like protein|uniref:T9SS type B sorting domain-containing protein n=1 Tax=Fluviicola sp. TaxID=1917219 RepID=UPI00283281EE|nr:gliding motility-associated C-terminal domain-containing protein [Fluviicola sp.]MDR0802065.1 gliding motility-associated C-terminal domain-containing protein [Fluviicola sp.]